MRDISTDHVPPVPRRPQFMIVMGTSRIESSRGTGSSWLEVKKHRLKQASIGLNDRLEKFEPGMISLRTA